jgi:carnitine 3-dehydrogenase
MELKDIKKVSCVGAGVIGYSYALIMALKGLNVYVYDITDEALNLAKSRVHESLKPLIDNKVIDENKAKVVEASIHYTKDMKDAVMDTYFIQESVPEHYEVKWSTIEEIEKYAPSNAIIASSTSGLLITEIAKNAKYPERIVGGHPYNPPHLIPLVEISKGEKTSEDVIAKTKEFYTLIGKEPVVLQKEALGFICNRLQMALYREVAELVMRGVCTVEDADKAVTYGPGIRWGIMGPSMVFELGGGKVGVDGLMNHLHDSITLWLNDMADWKEFPDKWPEIAKKGVEEEIKNRPKEIGNDDASLAEYRDKMLIEMLKLHNKL